MPTLTKNSDMRDILKDLWPFSKKVNGSGGELLLEHFVRLHNEGTIRIITDNLLDENTWDATLRIDIKDLSAYGLVKLIIRPLQINAKYDEIAMVNNTTIEFWWD